MSRYTVVYARDPAGAWLTRVRGIPGCHTHGRTLEQARTRIREALSLWIEDADSATLRDEVRLPARARAAVRRARVERDRAERQHARAQDSLRSAAASLASGLGLSLRDAAELLGLSHQRIQQLTSERSLRSERKRRVPRRGTLDPAWP
jgi:predicted RNase H-like HicB family nuclease